MVCSGSDWHWCVWQRIPGQDWSEGQQEVWLCSNEGGETQKAPRGRSSSDGSVGPEEASRHPFFLYNLQFGTDCGIHVLKQYLFFKHVNCSFFQLRCDDLARKADRRPTPDAAKAQVLDSHNSSDWHPAYEGEKEFSQKDLKKYRYFTGILRTSSSRLHSSWRKAGKYRCRSQASGCHLPFRLWVGAPHLHWWEHDNVEAAPQEGEMRDDEKVLSFGF